MSNEPGTPGFDVFLKFVSACAQLREYDALLRLLAQRAHWLLEFERLTVFACDDDCRILRTIVIEDHSAREVSADEIQLLEMDSILQALITGAVSNGTTGISIPLISGGRMIGGMSVALRSERCTEHEMNIARFLADSLAGTLDRLAHGNLMTIPEGGTESAIRARELSIATHHAVSLRMSHLAQHDALTDLPNRWLLNERLVRAIALSSRYRRRLAVMFLDLDKFKPINDSLGHAIGDQVLRQISHRLMKCVRVSDTVSRIGGDEFVILLTELEGENNAAACACKIIAAVAEPLEIGPHVLHLGLSIGIGMYPGDGDDAETLIMNADTAMYRSKAEGYGKCHFFNKDVHVDSRERREA